MKKGMGGERTTARRVLRSLLVVGVLATVAGTGAYSAFSATTGNANNQFEAGTVAIGDNDAGAALFTLGAMHPDDPVAPRCIVATYTGSLPSTVRLHGTTTGSGLAAYLDVKITRGTLPAPSFASCSGFTPDGVDYQGRGPGVVYDGTLQDFPDDYTGGIVDPSSTPESWTTGEAHAYRFEVALRDNDDAQGKTATQTFRWEARS